MYSEIDPKNTKTLNTIERTMVPNIPCHYHDISQSTPALEFEDWFPFGSLDELGRSTQWCPTDTLNQIRKEGGNDTQRSDMDKVVRIY